jgi:phosphoribosylaminoimidazole-succinocarboxamide synthase
VERTHHAVAVVLAAGAGSRFGATKQLAGLDGRSLVEHVVAAAAEAGVADTVVVVGHDADRVAARAEVAAPVRVVTNPDHASGQASSLRVGLAAAADGDAEVAVVLLADEPDVTADAIRAVVGAVDGGVVAARAAYDDGEGHPVAFARAVWPRLSTVEGDRGARDVLAALGVVGVPVAGPRPRDVDTPADLDRRRGASRGGRLGSRPLSSRGADVAEPTPIRGLRPLRSGKVRDLYEVDDDHLLLVASDRVSTYDVVHPTPIPDKGRVLTAVSRFWFDRLADRVDHHLVSTDLDDLPFDLDADDRADLAGRSMLCRKVEIVPFECVVRGYLVGSGWKEYQREGTVCGLALPDGLVEADRLPEPIFTPATKAQEGEHDENVSFEVMADALGAELAHTLQERSLELYALGAAHAAERGIILADTKFEFGLLDGQLLLADEVLTPDSSRYWPADAWTPGATPPSFDKQFVRDYATSTGWDKQPPAPELPEDVVAATRERYVEAYERLTGASFDDWLSG